MPSHDSVDAYLADQRDDVRRTLQRVRAVIKKSVRGLDESVSYKVPTYKLAGTPIVFFAAWKAHYSIYPATPAVFEALPQLLPFKHAKDTPRFDYAASVPVDLIAALVKVRADEVARDAAPAKPKPAARKRVAAAK